MGATEADLSPAQLATARSRALDLLGGLLAEGPTPERLEALRTIPVLAPHLPADLDADEAAAEHYRVMGRAVLPYESVFLCETATLGGPVSRELTLCLQRAGWPETGAFGLESDHVGCELLCLSLAYQQEATALDSGDAMGISRARTLQLELIRTHLVRWLAPLLIALEDVGSDLYREAVALAMALVADQETSLEAASEHPFGLPTPPLILDDPNTRLRDIARHLTTSVWTGGYLGMGTLEGIGRNLDLPVGFGSRADMLENLFHAAAHYDRVHDLVAALLKTFDAWDKRYQALSGTKPWQDRIETTRQMLNQLGMALKTMPQDDVT